MTYGDEVKVLLRSLYMSVGRLGKQGKSREATLKIGDDVQQSHPAYHMQSSAEFLKTTLPKHKDLLVYRAVLLGIICLTAMDSTDLTNGQNLRQIVRML